MFEGAKNSDKIIDNYLGRLDRALTAISAGSRAEIVLEMRANIALAQEKNPEMSTQGILEGLGEPELVANHYLLERGLELQRPPKPSHFKWIVIGFLGCATLFALVLGILIYLFTPILKIDESTGRVQLFGGAFDIQAKKMITQLSKEGSFVFGNIAGAVTVAPEVETLEILMGSGNLRIDYNATAELNWDCDGVGKSAKANVLDAEKKLVLDFSAAFVDCDVTLPQKPLHVLAIAADIAVKYPHHSIVIKAERGTVELAPATGVAYKYKLKAQGEPFLSDDFVSSDSAEAVSIDIEVIDGEIIKLD